MQLPSIIIIFATVINVLQNSQTVKPSVGKILYAPSIPYNFGNYNIRQIITIIYKK